MITYHLKFHLLFQVHGCSSFCVFRGQEYYTWSNAEFKKKKLGFPPVLEILESLLI